MEVDYHTWQKIYKSLLSILETQQSQLKTLDDERKALEEIITVQHNRWVSDLNLLNDRISELEEEACRERKLLEAKSDLMVAIKQKGASLYKLRSERSLCDLEDMKQVLEWFALNHSQQKSQLEKQTQGEVGPREVDAQDERDSKNLKEEIKRLKRTVDKLTSQKKSEVNALLNERNFVWNQLKKMESDYGNLLKTKSLELQQANEKNEKLLLDLKKTEMSEKEKDKVIDKLKTDLARLEKDEDNCIEEVSRQTKEMELLRRSKRSAVTPIVRCSRSGSRSGVKNETNRGKLVQCPSSRELSSLAASGSSNMVLKEKLRGAKRKSDTDPKLQVPRLFSSSFKLPKLKNPTPVG
ncbi:hypothetical protein H6P81_018897 [Aristolochia fimbriata]|uniref:Uncharacterized protein n=1 Tax=Aristolochia fimbriata TaxID=158543 RepID=A0AAV7E6S0_ARIFI|nr:hypothetical protein H6P81_018897 [Aristolochia fimbriata]